MTATPPASPGPHGVRPAALAVLDALERWAFRPGPAGAVAPPDLRARIAAIDVLPEEGEPFEAVLDDLGDRVLAHGVRPWDPACLAHLHAPTLPEAAAAELAIGATNQSLDSYDQAPAATLLEDHLVRWLAGHLGLPPTASGVLTAGGTASNLLGLLLARDHAAGPGEPAVADHGLPPEATGWRIVASADAHFSVARAAAVLGLGRSAVVPVRVGDEGGIDVAALDRTLDDLDRAGRRVIALVGTAGTTDRGAVDPLPALADRAAARGAWFHVDAAVGVAFAFSDRLRPRLAGLERADSVTADLHKLCWQPIGASVLLAADGRRLGVVRHPSDYLDRPDDDPLDPDDPLGDGDGTGGGAGGAVPCNLVARSLDTSRRFDALKVVASLRTLGRRRLGAGVEHLVDTAAAVAGTITATPDLELVVPPSSITVLFRWHPPGVAEADLDAANAAIQRELFAQGLAVL
ncbi:MAG TPA: pyridoxal-dependent decarboxylase, partial [Acidimicrobiales bacterium]